MKSVNHQSSLQHPKLHKNSYSDLEGRTKLGNAFVDQILVVMKDRLPHWSVFQEDDHEVNSKFCCHSFKKMTFIFKKMNFI